MDKQRSFLKWAGNKYHCINHILKCLPTANRLIEPFTGSGAIFINTDYSQYLLGESNSDLVDLFNHVKDEGSSFIQYCAQLFTVENNQSEVYYHFRQHFNRLERSKERAALFLYLNRHGYNGLCRYNQKGGYNVPFGRYAKPYFPYKELDNFNQKSKLAQFVCKDFRETFSLAQAGDVIYCDPPYVPLTHTANFSNYTRQGFMERDQIDLANLAQKAALEGVTVLISNHDTPFTRHHYQKSRIFSFDVRRNISCNGNLRKPIREILAVFDAK